MTRFEELSKKDRDEVLRCQELHSKLENGIDALIHNSLGGIRLQIDDSKRNSLLASMFHSLRSHHCDAGIIRRILDDDVPAQVNGMAVSARLGFLVRLAGGTEYSGGYDCLHVFDVLSALAAGDSESVDRFVEQFPPPFKSGHKGTVLLANSTYALLNHDHNALQALTTKLQTCKDTRFIRAMYESILAIGRRDGDAMTTALTELVKGNKRQIQMNSPMQKLICIPAHAFYNLGRTVFAADELAEPSPPSGAAWDQKFSQLVNSVEAKKLSPAIGHWSPNPILTDWVAKLPDSISVDALLDP